MKFRAIFSVLALFVIVFAIGASAQQTITIAYDANGNTLSSGSNTYTYDSENHLIAMNGSAAKLVYNGDDILVSKTVNGVTTQYLIDDQNPTGLQQVMEEIVNGVVQRSYTYGHKRIRQTLYMNNQSVTSYYGYDGQGNVRQLMNAAGVVTDTYDYDAFGNLMHHTGTTSDHFLYRGEFYDTDLSLYYLRARWYNPATGRFMSRDPEPGKPQDPASLHKYLYAKGDPVNGLDPTGKAGLVENEEIEVKEDVEVKVARCLEEKAACILKCTADVLEVP